MVIGCQVWSKPFHAQGAGVPERHPRTWLKGLYFCGHPFKPCSRMPFWYTSALGMKRFRPHLAPYDHLYPDRTSNVAGRLEALAFPGKKKPWYWFDSSSGVIFSVALDAKKPRLQARNLEDRAVFIRYSVLFLMDSKSRKANFYYSSSVSSDSC